MLFAMMQRCFFYFFWRTLVFSACYACEDFEMNAVYFVNYQIQMTKYFEMKKDI